MPIKTPKLLINFHFSAFFFTLFFTSLIFLPVSENFINFVLYFLSLFNHGQRP